MNRYEEQAEQQRRGALRFSMMIWTAGIALVVVVILIVGLSSSAPSNFFSRAAIVAAILLLVFRQLSRRLRKGRSRAIEPDPQSRLNLND
jgi:hypothetical protein